MVACLTFNLLLKLGVITWLDCQSWSRDTTWLPKLKAAALLWSMLVMWLKNSSCLKILWKSLNQKKYSRHKTRLGKPWLRKSTSSMKSRTLWLTLNRNPKLSPLRETPMTTKRINLMTDPNFPTPLATPHDPRIMVPFQWDLTRQWGKRGHRSRILTPREIKSHEMWRWSRARRGART